MRDEVVMAENAGWDHGFLRCGSAKDQPIVHQVARNSSTTRVHNLFFFPRCMHGDGRAGVMARGFLWTSWARTKVGAAGATLVVSSVHGGRLRASNKLAGALRLRAHVHARQASSPNCRLSVGGSVQGFSSRARA
jgi:hypothetical protein